MELEITREEFEKVVYVATSSNSNVYDAVLPYIENEFPRMETLLQDVGIAAMTTNTMLTAKVKAYLCEVGFIKAIRHLSLTLTTAGFGVVSNDNVAPASSDKIAELEKALWKAADRDESVIFEQLMKTEGWGAKTKYLTSLLWNIYDVEEKCGIADIDHEMWVRTKRDLYDAQFHIGYVVSYALIDELRLAMVSNTMTEEQEAAVVFLQQKEADLVVIKHQAQQNSGTTPSGWVNMASTQPTGTLESVSNQTRVLLNQVIEYFESNVDSFPTYASSKEYEARHMEKYENTKDSAAYFFGS